MRSLQKLTVRMLKDHSLWLAGEAPTFDDREAHRLVGLGVCTIIGPADDETTQQVVSSLPAPTNGKPATTTPEPSGGTHPEAKSMKAPKATRPSSTRVKAPQMTRADEDEE